MRKGYIMGKAFLLESGSKFGKLTVIKLDYMKLYKNPNGKSHYKKYYLCQCECGNTVSVYQGKLVSGHTTSCGCKIFKHGQWKSRLYNIWRGIKKRCYDKKNKSFKYYGAKNITISPIWKDNFKSFYDWAMDNGYQEDLTIDRIDNNGNYEPSNCRWKTSKEQANNRTTCRYLTYNGETHTVTEWAEITNIPRHRIYCRLNANKPLNEVFKELASRK